MVTIRKKSQKTNPSQQGDSKLPVEKICSQDNDEIMVGSIPIVALWQNLCGRFVFGLAFSSSCKGESFRIWVGDTTCMLPSVAICCHLLLLLLLLDFLQTGHSHPPRASSIQLLGEQNWVVDVHSEIRQWNLHTFPAWKTALG